MQRKKRILIIAGFFPYPSFFGGAYDVYERIIGLKSLGYKIDLVCNYKSYPREEYIIHIKDLVDDLYLVKRKNIVFDLLNLKPLQVVSRKHLKRVNLSKEYDLIILESESVGSILENKTLKAEKRIIRIHNDESKYFFQLGNSSKNILRKLYYYIDALKFKIYSNRFFLKVDRLWFISSDEEQDYVHKENRNNTIHLPAPSNGPFVQQKLINNNVLFIGSLFMPNNMEALEWYLENIHHRLSEDFKDYNLIIVGGTGDMHENKFINKFRKYNNVKLYLNSKKLDHFYADASVFINPMQRGTGVKLKSINALVNGLPLVATKVGSEGIGLIDGKMFIKANTPFEFYYAIKVLFNSNPDENRKMVLSAQEFLENNSYLKVLKKELNEL